MPETPGSSGRTPSFVVMFSSGVGSWAAARRIVDEHGPDGVVLLFADVKGTSTSPHAGEDEDNYRFLHEAAADLGAPLVVLNRGEHIWETFRRRRRIGSSYAANCSEELKQKPAHAWLKENAGPGTVVVVGIDWSEEHRKPAVERAYAPLRVRFPLCEPPLADKDALMAQARARGLEPPRLYRAGFAHANCGGFCVRAGKAQFALLLREHPERYAYHEDQEQQTREHLDKDVAILQEDRRGTKVPLTLRRFREQVESQTALFDPFDIGGCGCFVDDGGAA